MLENNLTIDLCNAHIDIGQGESKTVNSIIILHKQIENKIKKEQQNFIKELNNWNKKGME